MKPLLTFVNCKYRNFNTNKPHLFNLTQQMASIKINLNIFVSISLVQLLYIFD